MPNVSNYDNEKDWMQVCVPKMMGEGREQDQAVAACLNMWRQRDKEPKSNLSHLFGNAFRQVKQGNKDYLIVPGVPAREQVMNTYLVPGDELARSVNGWNGTPISIKHPTLNNGSVNVPAPDVAIIGRFYNAKWDTAKGRMVGEYWIDLAEAMKYEQGKKIVDAIKTNKILETSTGYWADDEQTAGMFGGRNYSTIHRNLLPDHIAILPDAIGACSIKDGCGVNRNAAECDCDCPFRNANLPDYQAGHLPRVMLEPYSVNKGSRTAEQLESLRNHMKESGIDKPVILMRKHEGEIKIIDGNHRVSMAGEFGIDQIPVHAVDEDLHDLDPEMIYREWIHKQDQGYLNRSLDQQGAKHPWHKGRPGEIGGSTSTAAGIARDATARADRATKIAMEKDTPEAYATAMKYHMRAAKASFEAYQDTKDDEPGAAAGFKRAVMEHERTAEVLRKRINKNSEKVIALKSLAAILNLNRSNAMEIPEQVKSHPMFSEALYKKMSEKGMTAEEMVKMMDGMSKIPPTAGRPPEKNVRTRNSSASKRSRNMKLQDLIEFLKGKGVQVRANESLEEFEVEEPTTPGSLETDTPEALSAEEIAALKGFAAIAAKLNEQGGVEAWLKSLETLKEVPAAIAMAKNLQAQEAAQKAQMVATIKSNAANIYSDDELGAMPLTVLAKVHAQLNTNYAGLGGARQLFDNEDVLMPPAGFIVKKEA